MCAHVFVGDQRGFRLNITLKSALDFVNDLQTENTGEEVSIDKQVACEECPRWLKMTEVAWEKTEVAVC